MDVGGLGDKAKRALGSEQGEQRSDQALDKAEQFADEETGDKYDQQTDKAGDLADQRLGQQNGETAPDRAHPAGDQGRRSSRDRANWGSGAGDASPGPARRTFEPLETPVTGPSIRLVVPYFGERPSHFPLVVRSIAHNTDVDWLQVTDAPVDDAPPNAAVELGEFPHLAARIQSHVGFDISREELAGYDFWGHSDLDDRHQTARMTVWPSCSAT